MWGKGMRGKGKCGKGKDKDTTLSSLKSEPDQPATKMPNDESEVNGSQDTTFSSLRSEPDQPATKVANDESEVNGSQELQSGNCHAPMAWIPQMAIHMAMKGMKGMCKGKGRAGNGQCQQPRPCATEGCSFQATWHPTHCCHGCASKGASCHGPRCERRQAGDGVGCSADGDFLTPRMMASLVTSMLPKFLPHLVQQGPRLGHRLQMAMAHAPQLRATLQALKTLLGKTKGLEHCAEPLEGALQGNGESAGHFALSLATGLDVLPFDEQIAFLEAAFVEHWAKIQDLVSHAPLLLEHWQHPQVQCDGCQTNPIKGPRFKCKTCDNYDLCGECFAKKTTLNGGHCAEHEFECTIADFGGVGCPGMFPGMFGRGMWGKGMRGKGKCGKGKDNDTTLSSPTSEPDQPATKMPKDESEVNASQEKQDIQKQEERGAMDENYNSEAIRSRYQERESHLDTTFSSLKSEPDQPATKMANDESEVNGSQEKRDTQKQEDDWVTLDTHDVDERPKPLRFAIPVMLDNGREFLMEWEAGADLQQIATACALQHDIPEEMVPQLVDVAQQLSK